MVKNKIWDRFLLVIKYLLIALVVVIVFFLLGTIIGYTIIGDGSFMDIITGQFWRTLFGYFVP